MTMTDTKDGINKCPHHKQVLFTFSDVGDWNCNSLIVCDVSLPREGMMVMMRIKSIMRMRAKVRKKGIRPNNLGDTS